MMRMFENRVLMRIFGPKRDEVTRECRRLHNDVLNDLYSSTNIIREEWDGRRIYMGKPEGKRPLGIPGLRFKVNIKMDLQEGGWGMDWIDLAEDRDRWQRALVNAVMNFRVP